MPFFARAKRLLFGVPLSSHVAHSEKIPNWKALSTLSSDALSSSAYATDAILITLAAASVSFVDWSVPIALGITALLLILTLSYRQTIDSYPNGGGAYTVAKENLGDKAGLIAGASLLIDYVLTVSVSISAGVENIASAFPAIHAHKEMYGIAAIIILTWMNLRGIRESATIFAFPTYAFVFGVFTLIGVGIFRALTGTLESISTPVAHQAMSAVPVILILRAFASGCAALTGVEAISNGVTVFRPPSTKNAKNTLATMAFLLACLFLGITILAQLLGVVPNDHETLISILGKRVFGQSFFYYFIQVSTALILFLAANTAYAGFPVVASLLARDRYMPRQLASLGDRLVFSNGIGGLSIVAIVMLILFKGEHLMLLPLYAIGVFLSFTLAQAGMVAKHRRDKHDGWKLSLTINLVGAITTAVVLLDLAYTKFAQGAWMVAVAIPFLTFCFSRVHRHYLQVGKELSVINDKPPIEYTKMKHTVIIPISGVHRGVLEALKYALSVSEDVRACYVEIDPTSTKRIQTEWEKWAPGVPFVVLKSPFRSVIQPLIRYIEDVSHSSHDDLVTVVVPEFLTSKWWHQILHNQTALFIRAALIFKKRTVVTSIRYHLKST